MMSTTNQVFGILDNQFHLHETLEDPGGHRLYRAIHLTGVEVVVKFLPTQPFFDELARLFSSDDLPYFASCLYHYTPKSVSGETVALEWCDQPLFDMDEDMGVLVLEYVDGIDLATYMQNAAPMEQVDALIEVIYAMQQLDGLGLSYKHIHSDYLVMETNTNELKLIDMGPGLGPEEDDGGIADLASSVHQFGEHILPLVGRHSLVKKLRRRCMHQNPQQRPELEELLDEVKEMRGQFLPKRSLEIFTSFLKPAHLVAWVFMIWGSSIFWGKLIGEGEVPIQKRRFDLLQTEQVDFSERIDALRELIKNSPTPTFRALLIKDIAELTKSYPEKVISEEDLSRPIAVIVCKELSAVITKHETIQLGDWVRVNGRYGHVSDIQVNRIKLEHEGASGWMPFSKPRSFSGMNSSAVIVWNNPGNLSRLLSGFAELQDYEILGLQAETKLQIVGEFPITVPSDFITELKTMIPMETSERSIRILDDEMRIPIFARIPMYKADDITVSEAVLGLDKFIKVNFVVDPTLVERRVTLETYNSTIQEILENLDLEWEVLATRDLTLSVKPKTNPQQLQSQLQEN